jgi:hypothetical protein
MPLARAALPLLLLLPTAAVAQSQAPFAAPADAVAPGASVLRPLPARDGVDTLTMVMVQKGVSIAVGMLVSESRPVAGPGGVPAVRRVETTTSRMVPSTVDTFVVALRTLAPVSQRTHEDRVVALDFSGRAVRGTITEGERTGAVDLTLPAAVFYDNSMDLVLGALPLADGYAADLPVYDDETGTVAWRHVQVAGSERLPGSGEMADAWRVETTRGALRSTYWIDKRTHLMLRWALPLPNGAELRIVR